MSDQTATGLANLDWLTTMYQVVYPIQNVATSWPEEVPLKPCPLGNGFKNPRIVPSIGIIWVHGFFPVGKKNLTERMDSRKVEQFSGIRIDIFQCNPTRDDLERWVHRGVSSILMGILL